MAITADSLKNMSPKIKVILLVIAYVLIGYFYYFFILQSAIEKRTSLQTKLVELQEQVERQERIASQKAKYIKEVASLKDAFQVALTKLPDKREIQPLFQSVATSGKSAGLDFLLFEPKPPQKTPEAKPAQKPAAGKVPAKPPEQEKFYEEIPVMVTISGRFHNTLSFFEQVARLPRIINIENITMGEGAGIKGRGWVIKTNCIIKTYMFVDKGK
ncbi:MAG: type 4a pilus biogenesis protein PilO [Pseudomonadota bacterium]